MTDDTIAILLVASLGLLFLRSAILVIAPYSTLGKWCRETFRWCDDAKIDGPATTGWVDIEKHGPGEG